MTREQMKTMDPYILLSWTNMKLRDEFESLEGLCDEFDFKEEELKERLKDVGYSYSESKNQFKSTEV